MTSKLSDFWGAAWKKLPNHKAMWDRAILQDPDLLKVEGGGSLLNSDMEVGIEIELENVLSVTNPDGLGPYFWSGKEERSLRNRGWEYVSFPVYGKYIIASVRYLQKMFATQDVRDFGPLEFSDLAGLHVHLNVRNLETSEFASLLFLYTIFEQSMFRVSGDRTKSIYCVPLQQAQNDLRQVFCSFWQKDSEEALNRAVTRLVENSHANVFKYMALNYRTVRTYGTVEFRHAQSTPDPVKILNWVNLILSLGEYAKVMDFIPTAQEVFALNTNSEYEQFAREVFGDRLPLINHSNIGKEMAQGVSALKGWCIPVNEIYVDDAQKGRKARPLEIPEAPAPRRAAQVAPRMPWQNPAPQHPGAINPAGIEVVMPHAGNPRLEDAARFFRAVNVPIQANAPILKMQQELQELAVKKFEWVDADEPDEFVKEEI